MKSKLLLATGILLSGCLVGCGGGPKLYTATFITDGTPVEPMKTAKIETSPVTTKDGYTFINWFLDEDYSDVVEFPFTMEKDTDFYAKFVETLPQGVEVNNAVVNGHNARSFISSSYGNTSLDLRIIVEDDLIYNAFPATGGELNGYNDNIEIVFSPVTMLSAGMVENKTYKLMYIPGQSYEVRKYVNGDYSRPLVTPVATVTDQKIYTLAKDNFAGYGFKLAIPYSLFGFTSTTAKEKIALAFNMRNTIGETDSQTSYSEGKYLGTYYRDAWTHLIVDKNTNELKRRKVEGLIFGDSYTDQQFMTQINEDYANYDFYTCGTSGSKLSDWISPTNKWYERVGYAKPKHAFMHLGVNDIQNNVSSEIAFNNFKTLTESIHAISPDTKIHFLVVPCNFFNPINFGVPNRYNTVIKDYDEKVLNYIDTVEYLDAVRLDQLMNDEYTSFVDDGLHPNEFTYAKLNKIIFSICGFQHTFENDYFGCSNEMVGSAQLVYDNNKLYSPGYGQTFGWVKASGNDDTFEVSVSLKAGETRNSDKWPKFGIILKAESNIIFNYIDITLGKYMGVVNFHHWDEDRPEKGETFPWGARWDWNEPIVSSTKVDELNDYSSNFVTLKLVKYGGQISIFVNGNESASIQYVDPFEDMETNVGLLSFNNEFFAQDLSYSNKE